MIFWLHHCEFDHELINAPFCFRFLTVNITKPSYQNSDEHLQFDFDNINGLFSATIYYINNNFWKYKYGQWYFGKKKRKEIYSDKNNVKHSKSVIINHYFYQLFISLTFSIVFTWELVMFTEYPSHFPRHLILPFHMPRSHNSTVIANAKWSQNLGPIG